MIQAVNYNTVTLAAGDSLPLVSDINNTPGFIRLDGNQVLFGKPGLYRVTGTAVFAPTAAGESTIRAVSGGDPVEGMVSTFETTAADQECTFVVDKVVQVTGNCGGTRAGLGLETTVAGTLANLTLIVEKLA